MPEHEAPARAFYDHEADESRPGRRRRQVADWGVGEDAFDRLPSRRFSRAEGAHARRPTEAPARHGDLAPERAGDAARPERARVRRSAPPAERGAEIETPAELAERPTAVLAAPADASAGAERAAPPVRRSRPRSTRADVPRGRTNDGRRTIVIGEPHDEELGPSPRAEGGRWSAAGAARARRRPPPTPGERVAGRPDRIVAYAVALGLLLILIAILSAGH